MTQPNVPLLNGQVDAPRGERTTDTTECRSRPASGSVRHSRKTQHQFGSDRSVLKATGIAECPSMVKNEAGGGGPCNAR